MKRALSALICAAVLLLEACDDGDGPPIPCGPSCGPVSPTTDGAATAGTTVARETTQPSPGAARATPSGCPVEADVCVVAAVLEKAMSQPDARAIVPYLAMQEVNCPGANSGFPDPTASLCRGKPKDTKVKGYGYGLRASEGVILTEAELLISLASVQGEVQASATDDYGGGAFRLATIGVQGDRRIANVTYVGSAPGGGVRNVSRRLLQAHIRQVDGKWLISSIIVGPIFGATEAAATIIGGPYEGVDHRRWNPSTGADVVTRGGLYFGQLMKVSATVGDCLNLREAPSLSGRVLECLPAGRRLQLVGGPTSADGQRFWRIEHVPPRAPLGWVTDAFLEPE
jgi:hypothetical protein